MKTKISKYYIILISILLTVLGIFTSIYTKDYRISSLKNGLENIAISLNYYLLSQDDLNGIDYNLLSKNYKVYHNDLAKGDFLNKNLQITFIDVNGNKLGGSDSTAVENQIDKQEVKAAIKNKVGSEIRYNKAIKDKMLYVAVFQKKNVITRISIPLSNVDKIDYLIILFTALTIIIGIILVTIISAKISAYITKPLNEIIAISSKVSSGDYSKRIKFGIFN